MTTLGKYRHLAQASTPAGHFAILAIDHRLNLWESLQQHTSQPVTDELFTAFKRDVISTLAPHASAVLTDPAYGIGPGVRDGYLGGQVGLLAPLEVTNYTIHPSQRAFRPIIGWSVEKIKTVGASGVKLLLYYHPAAENAADQRAVVARVVEDCARWDIPLYLEPIAFSPDPTAPLNTAELREVVVESARLFCEMGADVLKAQFPVDVAQEQDETVWRAALAELNEACSAYHVPWALLSAGVAYDTFKRQTELACEAGASGVIVGRAVWNEAVEGDEAARRTFIHTTAQARIAELAAICAQSARSWRNVVQPPEVEAVNWYERYTES